MREIQSLILSIKTEQSISDILIKKILIKYLISNIADFRDRYENLIGDLIIQYNINMSVETIGKIIYIESRGMGYDDKDRLFIRFENHSFLDKISQDQNKVNEFNKYFQCQANSWKGHKIKIGDAFVALHPTGMQADSELQYTALQYAISIDSDAAYQSISMGIGQIMGSNYEKAGYKSAQDMFNEMSEGYSKQIEGMLRYIKNNGLDELSASDFFRTYNGPDNVTSYMNEYNNAVW